MKPSKPTLLATALACVLAGGVAMAQNAPKANAALEAQLAVAQKNLDDAARRVAEINRELGRDGVADVQIFQRHPAGRPVIGVVLAPDEQAGVRIAAVTPDSGAAKAGLKAGDRITGVNGTQVLGSNGELRLDNVRKLTADLDSGKTVRIAYARDGKVQTVNVTPTIEKDVFWVGTGMPQPDIQLRKIRIPGMAPDVSEEVIRLGPRPDCKGKDCKFPALAEAFRWNGLNLASIDPKLGKYFGTDQGVLVLSAGPDLANLQPGDVIQKIDGRAVDSPREAMDALRGKDADQLALVEYLRDRKTASTRIKAPKLDFVLPPPPPPAPPAPPAAPRAPKAPLPPPPPPAPTASLELKWDSATAPDAERSVMIIDTDMVGETL